MSADLVLLEGKVLTMNPHQPCAEAVAVKNNLITKIGTNTAVSQLIGKETKVIHLNGKTVLPGFIDTHIHVSDFGKLLTWLNLENAKSIKEIQSCLSQRIKQIAKRKWVIGRGWDQDRLAEKRMPTRFDLDAFSPDNPVVLYHQSGQVCVVNSKALEQAGIKEHVSTGTVRNPQTGEPTGILRDDATNLVWQVIPELSEEELYQATCMALEKVVQAGVTSIHWIVLSPVEIPIIQKLRSQNKLGLRIYVIMPSSLLDQALSAGLNVGGVLIFADGYLAARTAALLESYNDNPAEKGQLLCSKPDMTKLVKKIRANGFDLIIHAVGDKAVDAALTVIEEIGESSGKSLRSRIEQAAVLNYELIERMKKLQVTVSVQANVVASEFKVWSAVERLGAKRARMLFPVKTLLKNDVRVVGGSDCPMEPLNPLLGIQASVSRGVFSEEQVSVEDALCMYTINAAYASSEENIKGSIEAGKLADFTVLSVDPKVVSPDKISEIKVEMTIIGGQVVYSKEATKRNK
jgi:predicted amidohydrolase YtcJ